MPTCAALAVCDGDPSTGAYVLYHACQCTLVVGDDAHRQREHLGVKLLSQGYPGCIRPD